MTKRAHITSRPEYAVGDLVLGLCGKEFEVTTLWDDVPKDKPICRKCVDVALKAMSQADGAIEMARLQLLLVRTRIEQLDNVLNPEDGFDLDYISETDRAHQDEQEGKEREKEAEIKVKQTCICTWTDQENFEVNPDCPIHGAPVAPPQED